MKDIISVRDVRKIFKISKTKNKWHSFFGRDQEKKVAVDNISFSLKKGDFVGFIGPNGAGKSTTIKMLTGILTPSSGTININGIVPYENRTRHVFNIGVVFGQRTQLWWDLPPEDSFQLLAKMYRIPSKRYEHNLSTFIRILDLKDFLHVPVRKLSLGQKMRCELAAALLHDPAILFLDEPTIGLDLFAKESIRFFLKKINQSEETTILLTTHDLDDVENLCERVIIIDKGTIIEQDSLVNLKNSLGNEKMIAFEIDTDQILHVPPGCKKIKSEGNVHYIAYSDQKTPDVIEAMLKYHRIHDIAFVPVDITEIVKRAYNKK